MNIAADQTILATSPPNPLARSTRELWIETGAVLLLLLPTFFYAVAPLIWQELVIRRPFWADHLGLIVRSIQVSAPVLYIIWRSGEGWAPFGLSRIRLLRDSFSGLLIWIAQMILWFWIAKLVAASIGPEVFESWMDDSREIFAAPARGDYLLLAISSCSNGFAEEFVMRGYLIPRFEQLLGSSWIAVTVSTLLFAAYHAYQGPGGVIGATVFGLVYAIVFWRFRRIWPIAIAHAIADFIGVIQ